MPYHEKRNLGNQGLIDKIKGQASKFAGKAQEQFGKMTGNREQEAKGKARSMRGGIQAKSGDVERTIDRNVRR